jgi:ABC-type transport system involved in cytochrome bd biosynthesis fused ATPase/permease subunit
MDKEVLLESLKDYWDFLKGIFVAIIITAIMTAVIFIFGAIGFVICLVVMLVVIPIACFYKGNKEIKNKYGNGYFR